MSKPNIAFELERITVPIERILPVRLIKDPEKKIRRYGEIVASIRETGLIEPLMVFPQQGGTGNFLLTDGHLRLFACRELGMAEVECVISLDDESYTYNAKVNRLAPIQERRMILKAIESGVPIERIAKALNMEVKDVRAKMNVTAGLCSEAVDLLKEKQISPGTLGLLRKVTASRQIEIVELMVSANNFSHIYTEALLLGTPKDKLVHSATKTRKKIKPEEVARMEFEMESLEKEYKACEAVFSEKMLQLTVFRRYAMRILENEKVNRFIRSRHAEIHAEMSAIVASETVC